ncbi:MAG: hypothetical protein HQL36_11650 [Alphaproteobacteria bacterium]|nr:hypothetical protein [Alphaproteobacteria bacterium]
MDEQDTRMTLKTQVAATPPAVDGGYDGQPHLPPPAGELPLLGLFAVGFGILGIFTLAPVFAPLSLILGLIAIFIGQIGLGVGAIGLAMIAILTSPILMGVLGLGAGLAMWLG